MAYPRRTEKITLCLTKQQVLVFANAADHALLKLPEFIREACTEYAKKTLGAVHYRKMVYAMSDEQQSLKNMTEDEFEAWAARQNRIDPYDPANATIPRSRAASTPSVPPSTQDIIPYEPPVESPEAMQAKIRQDALERNQNDQAPKRQ